jgi:hypothetical protein
VCGRCRCIVCKFLTARAAPISAPCWLTSAQNTDVTSIKGPPRAGPSGRDLGLHEANPDRTTVNESVCLVSPHEVEPGFTNQQGVLYPCSLSRRRRLGRFANRRRSPKVGGPIRVPFACSLQAHDFGGAQGSERAEAKAEGMRKGSPVPFLLQSGGSFGLSLRRWLLIGLARGIQSTSCLRVTCAK